MQAQRMEAAPGDGPWVSDDYVPGHDQVQPRKRIHRSSTHPSSNMHGAMHKATMAGYG